MSPRSKTEPALCCINIVIVFSELIFVPIALAAYFRQPVLFGLTLLIALVFAYFPRRFGRVVKVALSLRFHLPGDSCYVGNEGLNAKNSYSPFFDQVGVNCAIGSYIRPCLTIDVFLLPSFIWTVMFRSSGMTKNCFSYSRAVLRSA